MSGLNVSLGYFLIVVSLCGATGSLLRRWHQRWAFLAELPAAFAMAACRLEVHTIAEVGKWAVGLGLDVTLTMLFVVLVVHGAISPGDSGNPSASLLRFLRRDAGVVPVALALAAQLLGAMLALAAARWYWALELTDMHMIKNMMATECSSALRVSPLQGAVAEATCALTFHLLDLCLQRRSRLLRVPLLALALTGLSYAASDATSGLVNPALAYALTFTCPGFTFAEYALVYWLGSVVGLTLALFLYMGHIPRLFARNLLYAQKARFRFRVPKGEKKEKQSD